MVGSPLNRCGNNAKSAPKNVMNKGPRHQHCPSKEDLPEESTVKNVLAEPPGFSEGEEPECAQQHIQQQTKLGESDQGRGEKV